MCNIEAFIGMQTFRMCDIVSVTSNQCWDNKHICIDTEKLKYLNVFVYLDLQWLKGIKLHMWKSLENYNDKI